MDTSRPEPPSSAPAPPLASRPAGPDDAVAGVLPAAVFLPGSVAEAEAAMAEAARQRLTLVFAGGRTAMDLGSPPRRLDAVVDTRGLSRVMEHVPADQIAVVEAGVRLGGLQRTLAASGQRLALDPPHAEEATVGGLLASNAFGPLRTRFGSLRDLLIGVSFVLADGTAAKAGGKVVKNVAGFDVGKLFVGSLGTLGLVTTATFRLHPLPETSATVLWPGRSAAEIEALPGLLGESSLEPAAVWAVSAEEDGRARWDAALRFEGFSAGVAAQVERLAAVLSGASIADAASTAAAVAAHDRVREAGPPRVSLKAAGPRSRFEEIAAHLARLRDLDPRTRAVWYPTLGLGFVAGEAVDAAAAARAIAAVRAALEGLGGSLVLASAPAGIRSLVDAWGAPPAALELMRAVKDRFDPDGRLAPGRFVGGL